MAESIINPIQPQGRDKGLSSDYQVYILRLWGEDGRESGSIRLSLEDTKTGQRTGFIEWEKLMDYLRERIIV